VAVALARTLRARLKDLGKRWCGKLGHGLAGWFRRCREARRVQVLADAVERLAGVPGRKPRKLRVDRVARSELDQAGGLVQARVEAVQRAHGGTAGDHPTEVVDAAVARADEALGGDHIPHRAAEVHTAR